MQEEQDVTGRRLSAGVHLRRAPLRCSEEPNAWSCSYQIDRAIAASAIYDNHFVNSGHGRKGFQLANDARLLIEYRDDERDAMGALALKWRHG
jgi:hypothetical protein